MEIIKDTVKNVMQGLETKKKRLPKDDPEVLLKKILSKKELKHIKFHYFKKGVLGIKVSSSPWLYHFSLEKETLLAKLTKKLPGLKDIWLHLGEIE